TAFLHIAPLPDLRLGPIIIHGPFLEGDSVQFGVDVFNEGDVALNNVALSLTDGSPSGPQLAPDIVLATLGPGWLDGAGAKNVVWTLSTTGLAFGVHNVNITVDPHHAIVESDETNNTEVIQVDVRPKADLTAALSFAPAAPEEGDTVVVSALVTNLQPTTA